jgi:perosamine synthetase
MQHLKRKKIQTMVHYETCLSDNPFLKRYKEKKDIFLNSLIFSKESLSLPIHPFLTKKEINYIIVSIKDFFTS